MEIEKLIPDRINFLAHFPREIHPQMKKNQRLALSNDETIQSSTIQEMPTGNGKSAKGYANLRALRAHFGDGLYFYVTSNKALVDQIKQLYPEFTIIYGRNEYDCLFYQEQKFKADEIPCSLLDICPHRVNQETGETYQPGAERCPYLDAKWKARKSTYIVCTMSFYLFTTLYSNEWREIKGVVVDECHSLADVIRDNLSYEITDYHLKGIINFLKRAGIDEWKPFDQFLNYMKAAVKNHSANNPLLDESEIIFFIQLLGSIKKQSLQNEVRRALREGVVQDKENLEFIKRLEMIIHDLHRYISSFEYSLDTERRKALNYTYAYLKPRKSEAQRVEHALYVKCYHVSPIINKIFPESLTFYMSATIGDIESFRMETGLRHPFFRHDSEFPVENTRIFLPLDALDLAASKCTSGIRATTFRRIVQACRSFADRGFRSLVLVVSEQERQQFLEMAVHKLDVVTYNKEWNSKMAINHFKQGIGNTLLGTFAQYGQGIDLPNQIAPVIFVLRPAYPPPNDPKSLYEDRRFKKKKWMIWNSKEMRRILQARGRNVRSETDRGVTFCMSRQYRKIVLKCLPKWLLPAYVYKKTFDEAVEDTLELLVRKI
jgi:Rad3-related DNA helicase